MQTALLTIVAALWAGPAMSADVVADGGTPAEVIAQKTGAGIYLTDKDGKSLYTYIADEAVPGKSACEDACAKNWPPVMATATAAPSPDWSFATRRDGSKQWAYKGKPLYRYIRDTGPWAMLGEGAANSWYVAFEPATTPADITIHESLLGRVFADASGMTLYTFAGDSKGKAECRDKCLDGWQPLWFPAIGSSGGDWTAATRPDGRKQWAYKGRPLYLFRSELRPGSTVGHGGKWQAAVAEPTPAMPSFITVQVSDVGPVLANAQGLTLYAPQTEGSWNFEKMRKETCLDACMDKYWRPVVLDAKEPEPVGNWSAVKDKDGARHLRYKGFGVYTFALDKKPGDVLRGEHYGSGLQQSAGFKAILQSSTMRLYP